MAADDPLTSYLATQDAAVAPLVTSLHGAIVAAAPTLDVAIKYRMLTYAIDQRWHTWVCAVGTSTKAVQLRFLGGWILDDPLGVLRPGSSTLMTWDLPFDADIDAEAVGRYVAEAVAKHQRFLDDHDEIEAEAKAAHAERSTRAARRRT